jgi:hypothetical protein
MTRVTHGRLRFVAAAVFIVSSVVPALGQGTLASSLERWHTGLPGSSAHDIIQIVSPGLIVPVRLNLDDEQDYRGLDRIYNAVPLVGDQYRPSASLVEEAYGLILNFKVIPPFSYSPEEKRSLRKAESVLLSRPCFLAILANLIRGKGNKRHASRQYARYTRYSKAYADLLEKYQQAMRAGAPPAKLTELQSKLEKIELDWNRCDLRKKIEQALAIYNALMERNPITIWDKVESEYHENQKSFRSGRSIENTFSHPVYSDWFNDNEWTVLSGYSPALEVRRVVIQRPWLDIRVLLSLDWTLLRSAPVSLLSDGQGVTPRSSWPGLMPLLPIEVILTRPVDHRDTLQIAAVVCKVVPKLPK